MTAARRLAADVVGYSRLMGEDEARACAQLSWMTTATRRIAPRKFLASLS